jgi:hypothetical protein
MLRGLDHEKKVIWGVVSTAKLGLKKVPPGMQKSGKASCSRSAPSRRVPQAPRVKPLTHWAYRTHSDRTQRMEKKVLASEGQAPQAALFRSVKPTHLRLVPAAAILETLRPRGQI